MYIVPITPFTLDLIKELNGGVRPVMEQQPTYFLLQPGTAGRIITEIQLDGLKSLEYETKHITITHMN